MSIKALVESIEMGRQNNSKLSVSVQGKLCNMVSSLRSAQDKFNQSADELAAALEELKSFLGNEFVERDSDMVKLMEGGA